MRIGLWYTNITYTPLCFMRIGLWYTCGVAAACTALVRLLTAPPHVGAPGGQAGQGV